MNDTPRTDKREKDYWDTPTSHVDDVWEFARELERENDALNETTKKHVSAYYELQAENAALKAKVEVIVKNYEDYKAENAALKQALDAQMQYQRELRADRDRLDWLMTQKHIRYPFAPHDDGKVFRERIDAAMGEGKL